MRLGNRKLLVLAACLLAGLCAGVGVVGAVALLGRARVSGFGSACTGPPAWSWARPTDGISIREQPGLEQEADGLELEEVACTDGWSARASVAPGDDRIRSVDVWPSGSRLEVSLLLKSGLHAEVLYLHPTIVMDLDPDGSSVQRVRVLEGSDTTFVEPWGSIAVEVSRPDRRVFKYWIRGTLTTRGEPSADRCIRGFVVVEPER